jgi:predicted PurR-regulated permease PerM
MTINRPIAFWIGVFAAVIAVVVLLREVLLPFVAGMVLAYLLDPVANRLERLGMNRLIATLIIIAAFVVGLVVLIVLSVPIVVSEVAYLAEHLPRYIDQVEALAKDPSRPWLSRIIGEGLDHAEQSVVEFTKFASGSFGTFLRSVWSGGQALIHIVSLAIVAPIAAFYLTYDWNRMIAAVDNWVPPSQRDTVRMLARQIDDTIGGFVRGQSALCLILGAFYAVTLTLIGLKHGALIGFSAGLISFVPYLGALVGLLVATLVAIAQFWPNWSMILLVPAIFFVGHTVADYVLAPYLVGRRVHLNPVWLMFALFAFGYLFGFVGLLIAVPLAAAIGVLMRFALAQYYASPLYAPAPAAPVVQASVSEAADPAAGRLQTELHSGLFHREKPMHDGVVRPPP